MPTNEVRNVVHNAGILCSVYCHGALETMVNAVVDDIRVFHSIRHMEVRAVPGRAPCICKIAILNLHLVRGLPLGACMNVYMYVCMCEYECLYVCIMYG